jgi:uracil-DNA glycosylase
VVTLGKFAYDQLLRLLKDQGETLPRPRPPFAHGGEVVSGSGLVLLASYHPSQQNTFTGVLTERSFDEVWLRVRSLLGE